MMKLMRTVSIIALAVALGVGLFAGDAEAAILDSVVVVTPDSGAVRGIDSLIVADVYFRTTHNDSSLIAPFIWLGTENPGTTVALNEMLSDTTATSTTQDVLEDSVETWIIKPASTVDLKKFVVGRATVDKSDVAKVSDLLDPLRASTVTVAPPYSDFGDMDSVVVAKGPNVSAGVSWKVSFFYKVSALVNKKANVTVFAAVRDQSAGLVANGFMQVSEDTVVIAQATGAFTVDGDRPTQTGLVLSAATQRGGAAVDGFTAAPTTKTVLGVGDTVKIDYDLGAGLPKGQQSDGYCRMDRSIGS
jgi:hypothetical protein